MPSVVFSVKSWGSWSLGQGGNDIWRGQPVEQSQPPLSLRRRVSRLGQQALRLAWNMDEKDQARLIFSSRHGEFTRTLSILDTLGTDGDVSPADFTLSVHHALAGLLSIAAKNDQGHSAVSAGRESLLTALLEAACCHMEAPEKPVLLAHYDEPLPAPYDELVDDDEENMALVLLLAPGGQHYRLSWRPRASQDQISASYAAALMADVLDQKTDRLDVAGERLVWSLERLDHAQA